MKQTPIVAPIPKLVADDEVLTVLTPTPAKDIPGVDTTPGLVEGLPERDPESALRLNSPCNACSVWVSSMLRIISRILRERRPSLAAANQRKK